MVIYGEGGFEVFLKPLTKCSCCLSNVFMINVFKINKSWQKSITNDKYVKIWQYKHPKLYIITFHIHHQKWVLWQGKHFPIHRMKPCQMDWRKLVVLEKCILLKRILVISSCLLFITM